MRLRDASLALFAVLAVLGLAFYAAGVQQHSLEPETPAHDFPVRFVVTKIRAPACLLDQAETLATEAEWCERLRSAGQEDAWYAVQVVCVQASGNAESVWYVRNPCRIASDGEGERGWLDGVTVPSMTDSSPLIVEQIPDELLDRKPVEALAEMDRAR